MVLGRARDALELCVRKPTTDPRGAPAGRGHRGVQRDMCGGVGSVDRACPWMGHRHGTRGSKRQTRRPQHVVWRSGYFLGGTLGGWQWRTRVGAGMSGARTHTGVRLRALDTQPPGVCGAPPPSCSERLRAGEHEAGGPVPRVDAAGMGKPSPGALAGRRPAPSSPPHGGNPGEADGARVLCGRELPARARGPHSVACQRGELPLASSDGPMGSCLGLCGRGQVVQPL